MISKILNEIGKTKIISIIRGIEEKDFENTLNSLYKGGIRCIEITMNTSSALNMIEKAKKLYGDKILVGAGTVLEEVSCRESIIAGADFVLAPTLSTKVIEMCNIYSKLAVPGVFTPTEILTAKSAGAQLIKVFPVSTVGPQYIKDILSPLNDVNLLPVGGVNADNVCDYIKAGSYAVGIGSCLVNAKSVSQGNFSELENYAKEIISKIQSI